jgi:hypothetical protein
LYNSIPRRIRSVIVTKGHITKYWKWQVCKINLKNIFPIFPYRIYATSHEMAVILVKKLWPSTVYSYRTRKLLF